MRKIFVCLLSLILVCSLCACKKETDPTQATVDIENLSAVYSVGLTEDGFYTDFNSLAPEYTYDLKVNESKLKEYIINTVKDDFPNGEVTFDDYLELYANDLMYSMGIDTKETVELNDLVCVSLSFVDSKGQLMENYQTESAFYVVQEDADEIVSSFLGHSAGDTYETNYTFPAEDEYHPSETATVKVTVLEVYYENALRSGVVESHLSEIQEVFPEVTDRESFLTALYPCVLGYHLQTYITDLLITSDIPVPEAWVGYEQNRLNTRLTILNMTREDYLNEMGVTEDEIFVLCEQIARENIVTMKMFDQFFDPLTQEDLANAYGAENLDYYMNAQGEPYLKLRLMRNMVLSELPKITPVVDDTGNTVDLSSYFSLGESTKSVVEEDNTEDIIVDTES